MTEFLKKERKILDESKTSWLEILQHSCVNCLYGITGGLAIGFVALFVNNPTSNTLISLFIALFVHFQVDSKILNRNKYVSKLGKNIIFPFPRTIGFCLGAYLSTFI